MFLLSFVNQVRAAQSRAPLTSLPDSNLGALELAMSCSLEPGKMRFRSPEAASDVAAEADLMLGEREGEVELPYAINRFVRLMSSESSSPSRSLDGVIGEAGW